MKQNPNCELVTIWDGNTFIRTPAIYSPTSGLIESLQAVDANVQVLEKEYIELPNSDKLPVCTVCHEYVMKPTMVSDKVGKGLTEAWVCRNPDCPSRE
jgi:hypothetical protein